MAERQHESQEPDLRGLLAAGAIITVIIALAVGVCLGLIALFGGFERPLARAQHNPMPEPQLQAHPLRDRQRYDEEQRVKLSSYRWVDRHGGVVQIPIGRAMQILATQGGPQRPTTPPTPRAAAASPSRSQP